MSAALTAFLNIGAGFHSKEKEGLYKQVCSQACRKAMELLRNGATAEDSVAMAIQILEDSPLTNAGVGSNLTLTGTVECDASLMEGSSLTFGAVGAISGVRNPILVAKKLVACQREGNLSLGRIPPCFLVGEGAQSWAQTQGIPVTSKSDLTTESTLQTYNNHKRRVEAADFRRSMKRTKYMTKGNNHIPENALSASGDGPKGQTDFFDVLESFQGNTRERDVNDKQNLSNVNDNKDEDTRKFCTNQDQCPNIQSSGTGACMKKLSDQSVQDTVGAVCVDCNGNMASGVSSGGISLKQPGRIGSATMFGAGCWASNPTGPSDVGVAVATTGTGEHLMRTLLAKECAEVLQTAEWPEQGLTDLMKNKFLGSRMLECYSEKYGGFLALSVQRQSTDLHWSHSTKSMCVCVMKQGHAAKSLITRLGSNEIDGKTFVLHGHKL
ncbi:threonine aspartase 1-like isoform X2 [Dreissena polymorpha]|uniref:threonine aspartase 1-like isoform X2 n=1 Tax=Dreissena polymorpha TaxID=45954 RepID=UPI00226499C5|nr:threonine aspartase 1-like isoform X2 [Dreissena polymorpha]